MEEKEMRNCRSCLLSTRKRAGGCSCRPPRVMRSGAVAGRPPGRARGHKTSGRRTPGVLTMLGQAASNLTARACNGAENLNMEHFSLKMRLAGSVEVVFLKLLQMPNRHKQDKQSLQGNVRDEERKGGLHRSKIDAKGRDAAAVPTAHRERSMPNYMASAGQEEVD